MNSDSGVQKVSEFTVFTVCVGGITGAVETKVQVMIWFGLRAKFEGEWFAQRFSEEAAAWTEGE